MAVCAGMSMFTTKNGLYERARSKFKIQDGMKLFSYPFYKQRRKDLQVRHTASKHSKLSGVALCYSGVDTPLASCSHPRLAAASVPVQGPTMLAAQLWTAATASAVLFCMCWPC